MADGRRRVTGSPEEVASRRGCGVVSFHITRNTGKYVVSVENRGRHPHAPQADDPQQVGGDRQAGFESLGLSESTLEAVRRAGYSQPTPVQAGLIPRAITGIDVLGQARTGTGKTASFVLPIQIGRAHG